MEKCYVMVKPEFAENREIIKTVITMLKKNELNIVRGKYVQYSIENAQKHYAEHFRGSYENAKGFYKELEDYITSGKAYGMVVEAGNAIEIMNNIKKEIRTVICDMANIHNTTKNGLHASDCGSSAQNEIAIFDSMQNLSVLKDENTL